MEKFRPGIAVREDNPFPVKVIGGGDTQSLYTLPMGYAQISAADLQSPMPLNPPGQAMMAIVQNNGGTSARWRDDGTDPTAAHGMRLEVGGERTFLGDLTVVRFCDEGANAVLDVAYYG